MLWRTPVLWLVTVLVLALAPSGCSLRRFTDLDYMVPAKRRAQVTEAAEGFAVNLRWGRYQQAAMRLEPSKRIEFLTLLQAPNASIRFTSFEVLAVELGEKPTEATALVAFGLHRLPSMTETRILDQQRWRYDPAKAFWYLDPELERYRNAVDSR